MKPQDFVIASEAKQSQFLNLRLLRRRAPRNDIFGHFFILLDALKSAALNLTICSYLTFFVS